MPALCALSWLIQSCALLASRSAATFSIDCTLCSLLKLLAGTRRFTQFSWKPCGEKRTGHHLSPGAHRNIHGDLLGGWQVEFRNTVINIARLWLFRRRYFKSTGSQRPHRPPVVQRVTASSRMNQLAYFIVMISLRPYHDFPLVFQTLAAVESMRPPV